MKRSAHLKRVISEGGKRGVEIEGAAALGGLHFFCTCVLEPDGDVDLLLESLRAMNAEAEKESAGDRLGCSGHIGKMLFSSGKDHLALAAYVPNTMQKDLCCAEWLEGVLRLYDGEMLSVTKDICTGVVRSTPDKCTSPLKIRDAMILEANNFLRARGLFPEVADDDDDDFLYGDDDFPC